LDCTPDSRQLVKQQYLRQSPFRTVLEIYSPKLGRVSNLLKSIYGIAAPCPPRGSEESALELSNYWCPNKGCKDYGIKNKGNIIVKEKFGKDNRYLLKCRTCKHCFSETRGTPFFCLHSTKEEVLSVLAMLPEKGSIRG
jgi:hypothetical protein